MLFSNRNPFPAVTKPTDIHIYALPSRSPASLLGTTSMPGFELAAHEQRRALNSTLSIRDIGSVDGGQALVKAVLEVSCGTTSCFQVPFLSAFHSDILSL